MLLSAEFPPLSHITNWSAFAGDGQIWEINKIVLVYGFAGGSIGQYTIPAVPATWSIYGANYGAGLEFGITDNVSIGGEYVGHYLTGETNIAGQSQNTLLHELRARVAIRF